MTRRIARHALVATLLLTVCACGPDYSELANFNDRGGPIVCFGDSITRGYGASRGGDYPAQLQALVGRPVINAGKDGDTTESGLARLERDVLSRDPWIVVVGLGGNDFLGRRSKDEVFRDLDRIVRRCIESGAMVVVVHSKFGVLDDPYRDGFREISERHRAAFVKNSLRGILGDPRRMSDPIHPNDLGYALVAERVADVLNPIVKQALSRE